MHNTLYLLIGPKGAGKTYIGGVIAQHTDVHFIAVEPIWLSLQPGADGWQTVRAAIDAAFANHQRVMIESLGAGAEFAQFLAGLEQQYTVKFVRVVADFDECLERVRQRDSSNQLLIPIERVAEYNRIAAQVRYPWAAVILNSPPATVGAIVAAITATFD